MLIKQGAGVERGTDGGWILEDEDHLPSSAQGLYGKNFNYDTI